MAVPVASKVSETFAPVPSQAAVALPDAFSAGAADPDRQGAGSRIAVGTLQVDGLLLVLAKAGTHDRLLSAFFTAWTVSVEELSADVIRRADQETRIG